MKTQLKKDEKVIFQSQPHWFILVGPAIVTLILLIICFAIRGAAIPVGFIFIGYFIYKVVERSNNLWAVTNLRVIDEFGVFSSNSKESPLEKINNVSYSQSFFGGIFGYGNVQIQTAAEVGSTTYHSVENPKELKDTITHMQEEYKHQQIKKQARELASAIAAGQQNNKVDVAYELEKLHELKQKGILTEDEYNTRKVKILSS
jgi:uncharacterized membrane protein YdbT with pleckstrin-like domain